jgi:DNA-binding NarL/FixJ family response regulator
LATSATSEQFVEALRAGEPRAVEARNRLLRTMSRTHEPDAVTERQSEVIELLAGGMSDGEIALFLRIRTDTVREHVRRAKSALGARTRPHMVVLWLAQQTETT